MSLRVILSSKENLSDLIVITNATFAWTLVSTETYAWVATIQDLGTGLGAWWTITWLMAKLTASLVKALPGTRLNAWNTGLPTWPHTLTVDTTILTWSPTGGAITSARFPALVGANQETFTLV